MSVVMQSCRRNLNTTGKSVVIDGLPELAGLVGQMAAQWETRMQQQATQMDTDSTAAEETAAADDDTLVSMPSNEVEEPSKDVPAIAEDRAQHVAQASGSKAGATASISGLDEADTGGAVDANADPTMPDVVSDLVASTTAAGVTSMNDSTGTADASESRRQKKQKASTKV